MKNIQIRDDKGKLIVDFNGEEWRVFTNVGRNNPEILYQVYVKESPYYLFRALEKVGNPEKIMIELSQKSSDLKELFDNFFNEKSKLKERIILFEKASFGAVEEFINRISLIGNPIEGFIVEATFEDDLSYEEFNRNAIGEVQTVIARNVFDANDLYEALQEITSDEHWNNLDWTWEKIFSSLAFQYPKLANDLRQIIAERGKNNPKSVKNEFYYFKRIESYCNANKFDLALQCANEGVEAFPFCELLYASRGEIYLSKQLIDKAITDYKTAIQLGMDESLLLNNLGICYAIKHQHKQAIECFTKAIELGKGNVNTYLARAKAFRELGKIELAHLDEEKARKIKTEKSDQGQDKICELHRLNLELQEIRRMIEFVSFSDEEHYFWEQLHKEETNSFPNAEVIIPTSHRKSEDGLYDYVNYLVCVECQKLKNKWIAEHEDKIRKKFQEERRNQKPESILDLYKSINGVGLTDEDKDLLRNNDHETFRRLGLRPPKSRTTQLEKLKAVFKKLISIVRK